MEFTRHTEFKKRYKRLPKQIKIKVIERLELFGKDSFILILNNHPLHGEYRGFRSINITGDLRAIYYVQNNIAIFTKLGTHSELFS